ncbi:MAG: enoyl-CoA hydratase-related protein [Lysobacterales bacterium]
MSEAVSYQAENGIALITIERPDQRNAINQAVREGLFDAFARVEQSAEIRVAILTGSGERAFCAGADLKEMAAQGLSVLPPGFFPVLGDNVVMSKPVIAAVNGDAFAGGWMLAQMCDLCVASRSARFGITEGRVGRGFPWAAPLIHMIPQRIMAELLMTARPISAQRAYEVGFVNRLAEPDQLLATARQLAEEIIECAPLTVAAAKQLIALSTDMGRSAALQAAGIAFERVYRSADAQEGPRAFSEKRKPRWQNA